MPKEKAKVNVGKALASVNASMAMEGLKPCKKAVILGKQYLEGKITSQEAVTQIKAQHLGSANKRYER